ncbi:hypothetical protein [Streptomyces sp. DH12]|uniref:hypothetical protein n=1 Tax=Streptomyces sp. DH12 TaxID=2857010 RepID=UPI001E453743|nr:hypothetical protein [Streptomyces sp. DH12]
MNPRQAAAARLTHGTTQLAQRLGQRATAWVRAARRDDLTGWQATLGCIIRAGLLLAGLWLLWRAVRAVPALMLLLVPVGLLAAWRAGRSRGPAEATEAIDEQTLLDGPPEVDIPAAVRATCGTYSGSHLAVLAQYLTEDTSQEWDIPAVRAACKAAGIPIDQVRMGTGPGAVTSGVRLKDLPDPLPGVAQDPAVGVVVAGHSTPTRPPTPTPTPTHPADERREGFRVEHIGASGRIVHDPADTVRHHTIRR